MSLYSRILEGAGPRKWDITHSDLPDGSMKLVQHSTGLTKVFPREQADQLRSDISEIERRWKAGVPQHTAYPNVHLHIDALLLPHLSEGECDNREADKPWRTPGENKKFAVCVNDGDDKKIVRFGDPNMEIKRDDPERRKNFRARHNCDEPGPKTKARYWSCQGTWHPKKTVSQAVGEDHMSLFDRIVQEERPERSGAVKVSLVKHKDQMPGGKGDKLKPDDVDPKELAKGIAVELEHTKDRQLAQEIALDHLAEFPDYYTRLERMEKEAEAAHEEIDQCLIRIEEDDVYELRDSCLDCVRKHLSQALVAMQEALQGYPEHRWLAIGHLGEASDEALQEYPALANEIREHRVKYMDDPAYVVPVMKLIAKASALIEANDFPSKFPSTVAPSSRTGVGTAPPEDEEPDALKIVQDGPDDDEEPDIPIKIVAQAEDEDLLERAPTKKELKAGKRPDDVTWKEWMAAGGRFSGGKSKPKREKKREKIPSSAFHDPFKQNKGGPKKGRVRSSGKGTAPGKKDSAWWDKLTKGMSFFDDDGDDWGSSKGSSISKPKPPPETAEEKKLKQMARSLGKINRTAAGGVVFKTFEGPDFWELPVLVSQVHPKYGSYWVFPKGGVDIGEHIYKGAAREVFEEAGVKAKVANPLAYKQTSTFGDRGKYDLPLVLMLLKKKFPQEHAFIDANVEKIKWDTTFTYANKSHYFIMAWKGGKPRKSPGGTHHEQEMNTSEWVPLRVALTRARRGREIIKFLLPVMHKMWKPTGEAAKQKKERPKMPAPSVKPTTMRSSSKPKFGSSGDTKGGGHSYLSLF